MLVIKANRNADRTVGITRFFFDLININIQNPKTAKRYSRSESDNAPAGKIIILPRSAAKVE